MDTILEWTKLYAVPSTLILAITVALIVRWILYRPPNAPPGPIGLPIVGYLPFIRKDTPQKLNSLKNKYGSVFSLYLGSRFTVVLSDYQAIKEGLNKSTILGRLPDNPFDILEITKNSKVAIGGKPWLEQRRFILNVLKTLGLGRNRMEQHINEEISYFLEEIAKYNGKKMIPLNIIAPSTSNNICSLVFGRRFDYGSTERKNLDENLTVISKHFGQTSAYIFMPWLKPILFSLGWFQFNTVKRNAQELQTFILKEVEEHKKTLDVNNMRDYIDGYLIELEKRKDEVDSYFNMPMLTQTIQGLFGAGSGTIKTSLGWATLIMAKYQTVQERVQREINDVIGIHRKPTWSDHKKMPYTEAVIMEMQRWKTIVPINVLRYCQEDTELNGFIIPKDSIVLANFWTLHHDVDYWKDPEVFRPERFLNETQNELIRHDALIPFSIGKMSCGGESLAKVELFLYFVAILQRFKIKPPDGVEIDMTGSLGITYESKPQELCFLGRA